MPEIPNSYAVVLEEIATISTDNEGNQKRLRRVSWRHGKAKLDIRTWIEDGTQTGRPGKGITLTVDEAAALRDALTAYLPSKREDGTPRKVVL